MRSASLYICYQSIFDPLTLTQVVAYLEGLSRAGYRVILLTFEPQSPSFEEATRVRSRLLAQGIVWYWKRYHKRPSLPATLWDVLVGTVTGLMLIRRYRVKLVHARIHVPGLMAIMLKWLCGVRFIFDIRGFIAEEYVDSGVWRAGGLLYRITKYMERRMVQAADGIVVLTNAGESLLRQWYSERLGDKPVIVIPCCVDLRRMSGEVMLSASGARRNLLIYVGKLGGWYLAAEMAAFIDATLRALPEWECEVWSQSDPAPLRSLLSDHVIAGRVKFGTATSDEMPLKLMRGRAGLSFRANAGTSRRAASPTKVGEYLAAGLFVISNRGIGDLDKLFAGDSGENSTGVVIDLTPDGYAAGIQHLAAALEDPATPEYCRRLAEQEYDLHQVGWVRYAALYNMLIGPPVGKH